MTETRKIYCDDCGYWRLGALGEHSFALGKFNPEFDYHCVHPNSKTVIGDPFSEREVYKTVHERNKNNDCKDYKKFIRSEND